MHLVLELVQDLTHMNLVSTIYMLRNAQQNIDVLFDSFDLFGLFEGYI